MVYQRGKLVDVAKLIQKHGPVSISDLTVVEMRCLLAGKRREKNITPMIEMEIFATFQEDVRQGSLVCHPFPEAHTRRSFAFKTCSLWRQKMTTQSPCLKKTAAVSRPIPRVDPVISTILSYVPFIIDLRSGQAGRHHNGSFRPSGFLSCPGSDKIYTDERSEAT